MNYFTLVMQRFGHLKVGSVFFIPKARSQFSIIQKKNPAFVFWFGSSRQRHPFTKKENKSKNTKSIGLKNKKKF